MRQTVEVFLNNQMKFKDAEKFFGASYYLMVPYAILYAQTTKKTLKIIEIYLFDILPDASLQG